jgi:hypothetical protein
LASQFLVSVGVLEGGGGIGSQGFRQDQVFLVEVSALAAEAHRPDDFPIHYEGGSDDPLVELQGGALDLLAHVARGCIVEDHAPPELHGLTGEAVVHVYRSGEDLLLVGRFDGHHRPEDLASWLQQVDGAAEGLQQFLGFLSDAAQHHVQL